MKSLLKKGEKSEKGTPKPKKSLFGKKPVKKIADDLDEPVAPKKTGFSLTKKRQPAGNLADGNTAEQGNKKVKPTKKSAKSSVDTKKLVPILGGLLALVLLALAAKMFLFSEPEVEPVVPTIPPPPAQQPVQPATPVQPTAVPPAPEQATQAEQVVQEPAPVQTPNTVATPALPATQDQPVPSATPVAPVDVAQMPAQAPRQFTREEFLQESKNKVYRERETTQPTQ